MSKELLSVSYLGASLLFMLSIGGLSKKESAQQNNIYGMWGMLIGVLACAIGLKNQPLIILLVGLLAGGGIGALVANRVAMTSMPELVAILHSFVGLAAMIVSASAFLSHPSPTLHTVSSSSYIIYQLEIILGVFIGGLTFTGSLIAFGKLRGIISGKPFLIKGRHEINLLIFLFTLFLGYLFLRSSSGNEQTLLFISIIISSLFLGGHLMVAIGGADMPVMVSLLNSYSGWAASANGFMLGNEVLIITGALVGSSGAILSHAMCKAMNRSLTNVIFGGFGSTKNLIHPKIIKSRNEKTVLSAHLPDVTIQEISAEETAIWMNQAKRVVIIPGYGMAVAQAQSIIKDISVQLEKKGARVDFAIHPVAGRLPGHMNVLLAEADIPYGSVLEMEDINPQFPQIDVTLVIGANDIVNSGSLEDPTSPIFGMPVLKCWEGNKVIIMKRSLASGYSGIDNPLFYKKNTFMLFGDAREKAGDILQHLQNI